MNIDYICRKITKNDRNTIDRHKCNKTENQ